MNTSPGLCKDDPGAEAPGRGELPEDWGHRGGDRGWRERLPSPQESGCWHCHGYFRFHRFQEGSGPNPSGVKVKRLLFFVADLVANKLDHGQNLANKMKPDPSFQL